MLKLDLTWQQLALLLGVKDPDKPTEQLPIEIRHTLIQTFTDKYLKGIANDATIRQSVQTIEAYAKQEVDQHIGRVSRSMGSVTVTVNPEIEKRIKASLDKYIDTLIEEALKKTYEEKLSAVVDKLSQQIETSLQNLEIEYRKRVSELSVEDDIKKIVENVLSDKLKQLL